MRALGIDPGTKSFDIVLVDGERVVFERSVETEKVARDPDVLIRAIEEIGEDVDMIAGPSGYGTPVVCNNDIIDPRRFALEVLLLSDESDIREGVERGELGIYVYDALAKTVEALWRSELRVCYIPSVILLPTVPLKNKLNRLDMGTADKLASTVLAVWDQSRRLCIGYDETSFILVEMGFGYNAVIAVDGGRIVDGLGGTMVPMGFLTIGSVDAEIVVGVKRWSRGDVFHGGVSSACGEYDVLKIVRSPDKSELCAAALEAMIDWIERAVRAMLVSVRRPREIVLSGRLSRVEEIARAVEERVSDIAPVSSIRGLPGASIAKEAAQGYAVIGEGIAGGVFRGLIEHMRILDARGTVADYICHPKGKAMRERLVSAYRESVRADKVREILGE